MQTTKSGRMVKWGPIDIGKSFNFYFQSTRGSKEQIKLKSEEIGEYYCFPIVVEGEDVAKMLPLNEKYDANLIKIIEESGATEVTLCKLSKVPYKKKDGSEGGKLHFEIVKGPVVSTSDDSPPLEEYLKDPEASQVVNSGNINAINVNKTQGNSNQKKDGMTLGMCFKVACDWCARGVILDGDIEDRTRDLYTRFQKLISE